jgi:hypothetical protein
MTTGEEKMENELPELKKLYTNLWEDARTLVKDISHNIRMIGFFGFMLLAMAIMELGSADASYSRIIAGVPRTFDYLYFVGGIVGSIAGLLGGILMIRYYFKLKDRYARVLDLESKLEQR